MISIPVSNAELLDKYTILLIKNEKGLAVENELLLLSKAAAPLFSEAPGLSHLFSVLRAINSELWDIEDKKREHEKAKQFDRAFIGYARLVYMLNDERARIKQLIDTVTDSEISEVKSHFE